MTWPAVAVAVLIGAAVLMLPRRGGPDGLCDGGESRPAPGRVAGPVERPVKGRVERGTASRDDPRAGLTSPAAPEPWTSGPSARVRIGTRDPDAVASALALLALAYRTGLPTWQVLTVVAQTTTDPVAADLRQVATALQWGASESEAWASVGPPWAAAARVVSLAHAGGVPPGPLLTAAADDLHRAELDRLEVAAAQVGVRLVAPLGLVLLPAFCLTTVVPLVVALGGQLLAS